MVFRRYIGLEFRHQHPEAMQRLNFISGFHRFGERPEPGMDFTCLGHRAVGKQQFRVDCPAQFFLRVKQFFVQFFTGTQTGKDNLDIPPDLKSRELNHFLGKIRYAHRLAHIQHENLTAPADGAGLQDQAYDLQRYSARTTYSKSVRRTSYSIGIPACESFEQGQEDYFDIEP